MSSLFGSINPVPEWVTPGFKLRLSEQADQRQRDFFNQQIQSRAADRQDQQMELQRAQVGAALKQDEVNLDLSRQRLQDATQANDDRPKVASWMQSLWKKIGRAHV